MALKSSIATVRWLLFAWLWSIAFVVGKPQQSGKPAVAQNTITMGQYLFSRIRSLGVEHVIGVPGDFNLRLLDELYKVPGLKWLGACNELNAAYAADGYSRIKGIPAVLVTTYGVGELSAFNGIAGAYAEHAPIIHIVGMTPRMAHRSRTMLHHTLKPNMDHNLFVDMAASIRSAHAVLNDEKTMAQEIDRVIIEAIRTKLPVFLYVPSDVVATTLDARRLSSPLDTKVTNINREAENIVVNEVLSSLKAASNPAILIDVLTIRHDVQEVTKELVDLTRFPTYSTLLSKGVINETSPYYNGLYNGRISFPGVQQALENSDLIINIGPLLSDTNTGGFSRNIPTQKLLLLAHDHCQIRGQKLEGLHFKPVLDRIVQEIKRNPAAYNLPRSKLWTKLEEPLLNNSKSGEITQSFIWQRIGRFLQENDIVIVEAGTAQYGMPDAKFPTNVKFITQAYWSSIGYSVGATLGAAIAAREMKHPGRVILIVGEGSLQMTVQEVGTYIRYGFTPIIFVINNNGYSIERAINGPKQTYNDVSMLWDHQSLLSMLGARKQTGLHSRSFACRTIEELEKVLYDKEFAKADQIQLVEVFMDQFDYPWRLQTQLGRGGRPKSSAGLGNFKESAST